MSPLRRCATWIGALVLAMSGVMLASAAASADSATPADSSDSSVVVQPVGGQTMATPDQDSIWG